MATCKSCGEDHATFPFRVIDGTEPYKVIDLDTGGESFYDCKYLAYRAMSMIQNHLGHNYRLEVRS
jgi:hypothetical protein